MGYDSAYIHALRTHQLEDSEDYLLKLIEKQGKFDWRISPGEVNEVIIRIGQRYYITDRDIVDRLPVDVTYDPEALHIHEWSTVKTNEKCTTLDDEEEEREFSSEDVKRLLQRQANVAWLDQYLPESMPIPEPEPQPQNSVEERLARIEIALAALTESKNESRPAESIPDPPLAPDTSAQSPEALSPPEITSCLKTLAQSMVGLEKMSAQRDQVLISTLNSLNKRLDEQYRPPRYENESLRAKPQRPLPRGTSRTIQKKVSPAIFDALSLLLSRLSTPNLAQDLDTTKGTPQ